MIKFVAWGLEGVVVLLILVAAYSQLIRPLLRKTPVFPVFRRVPAVEQQIEAVNESLDTRAQERALEEKKRQL